MCYTPFEVRNKLTKESIPVPCGKCPKCRSRRASGWSFRLTKEAEVSTSAFFITLTYDTKHVPITANGFMSLDKKDTQLFMKRLRKLNQEKLRYYTVGEYGGKTNRPHYHIILFNAELETIQQAWTSGEVHYGTVEGASIGYCLKYISKPGRIPMHKNDDRQPEFQLMSKGLGKNYINSKTVKWHTVDLTSRMYLTMEQGQKISMPRYYKNKIYHEDQRKAAGWHARKAQLEKQHNHPSWKVAAAHTAAFRNAAKKECTDKL